MTSEHVVYDQKSGKITEHKSMILRSCVTTHVIGHYCRGVTTDSILFSPHTYKNIKFAVFYLHFSSHMYVFLLGATIIGKTACEDFCLGGGGYFCASGPVLNPFDKTRCVGGSSSGNAALVSTPTSPFL